MLSRGNYQSRSLDDLRERQQRRRTPINDDEHVSNTTRTEADLTRINYVGPATEDDDSSPRSRSAPVSPTQIDDRELAAFIRSEQDHFVYNVDLSDPSSRLAICEEDESNNYPPVSLTTCLTITEENEEELEQLRREEGSQLVKINEHSSPMGPLRDADDRADLLESEEQRRVLPDLHADNERLSTIYESPSPQLEEEEEDEEIYDKLIVYDRAPKPEVRLSSPQIDRSRLRSCFTESTLEPCPSSLNTLSASNLCGTTTMINSKVFRPPLPPFTSELRSRSFVEESPPVQPLKVNPSSSSSLSDFVVHYEEVPSSLHHSLTDCSFSSRPSFTRRILTNGLLLSSNQRRPAPPLTFTSQQQHRYPKSEEKLSTLNSSSSSQSNSPSTGEKLLLSRSDHLLQQVESLSPSRKATSLKSIRLQSNILYPIEFETKQQQQQRNKVPTSDSGIVIDTAGTRPTSKSSIDEPDDVDVLLPAHRSHLQEYEHNYRQTLADLTLIKKNIVETESRLNEAMRELEIERALVEGEHDLLFKQMLDASETDQEKLRHLYDDLQLLIDRIMAEKTTLRHQIDYTEELLFNLEDELHHLERDYRSPDDKKILKKKELIVQTRQQHEDLEFQLMELETRAEAELEQAEDYFQNQRHLVTQNSQYRQNTLRDLDDQQEVILHQVSREKEKLEREKQQLKLLFKQKKFEAHQLEEKINQIEAQPSLMYQSTPSNLYSSLTHDELFPTNKLEKMSISDRQVKLREKNRLQERPLTRYLPIRALDFDLRAHIEGAGHLVDSPSIHLTSTSCRGFLHKMGGMKFKTWNRRWFVFDRKRRSLFYYQDKTETKLRGVIYFQSIVEVYVDHLQSISIRSPEPREATFIVKTVERPFYLVAPTVEAMRIWVDVLITGAEGNTFAGET